MPVFGPCLELPCLESLCRPTSPRAVSVVAVCHVRMRCSHAWWARFALSFGAPTCLAQEECNDTGTFVITFLAIMMFLAVMLLSKAGLLRLPVCACRSRQQGKSPMGVAPSGGTGTGTGSVGVPAGAVGAGAGLPSTAIAHRLMHRTEAGPVQHSRRLGRCDARFVSLFLYYFQVRTRRCMRVGFA